MWWGKDLVKARYDEVQTELKRYLWCGSDWIKERYDEVKTELKRDMWWGKDLNFGIKGHFLNG